MRSREKAYEILSIRDFGKPSEKMLRFCCLIIRHLGSPLLANSAVYAVSCCLGNFMNEKAEE